MIDNKILKLAIKTNKPILLVGKHGIGKSYSIGKLAQEENKKLLKVICTSDTTPDDLIGSYELKDGNTQYIQKPLLQAVINGDWLLIDEINTANSTILTLLNGLLETDYKQRFLNVKDSLLTSESTPLKIHADFRLFCTANPSSYAHTQELSESLLSRFLIMTCTPDYEYFLDQSKTNINYKDIKAFVSGILRSQKSFDVYISPRELLNFIDLMDNGLNYTESTTVILNKFFDDISMRNKIAELFQVTIENKEDLEVYNTQELEKKINDRLNTTNELLRQSEKKSKELKEELRSYDDEIKSTRELNTKLIEEKSKLEQDCKDLSIAISHLTK